MLRITAVLFLALGIAASLFGTIYADDVLSLPGIGNVNVTSVSTVNFNTPGVWESYSSPSGVELGAENGVYRAYTPNPGYVWGLNKQEQADEVVEVQVTPLTIFSDIGAGVMCRADESDNGNGYYFVVNVNGYYSIRIGTDDGVTPLIDWQRSRAVHTGIDSNTIRAVCMGNQLAMYVNGTLVAHVTDSTYSKGYTGLAVAAGMNGVDESFDKLTLYTIQSQ